MTAATSTAHGACAVQFAVVSNTHVSSALGGAPPGTTSQATTSSEVKFTQGPYTVDAVGMSVDLTKGLVRLESRVNGLFTPP